MLGVFFVYIFLAEENDDLEEEAASYARCSTNGQSLFAARPRVEENNIKLASSGRFNHFETEGILYFYLGIYIFDFFLQ